MQESRVEARFRGQGLKQGSRVKARFRGQRLGWGKGRCKGQKSWFQVQSKKVQCLSFKLGVKAKGSEYRVQVHGL